MFTATAVFLYSRIFSFILRSTTYLFCNIVNSSRELKMGKVHLYGQSEQEKAVYQIYKIKYYFYIQTAYYA